jgi:hypothetical protein
MTDFIRLFMGVGLMLLLTMVMNNKREHVHVEHTMMAR